jgi:hypothetical protein
MAISRLSPFQFLKTPVKIASCLVIGGALLLEMNPDWAGNLPLLWFAHLALGAHGLEALGAFAYGLTQGRSLGAAAVQGVTVFWTGTVGLAELLERPQTVEDV